MKVIYFLFILICAIMPGDIQAETNGDNNQVATAKWTEEKIDAARGVIPVGGADGDETAKIWIE